VSFLAAGTCTLTASVTAGTNYQAATGVAQSFTIGKRSQTITFTAPAGKVLGDPDFTVTASASSGLAVTFSASGSCTNSGAKIHLTTIGSCVVLASQAGNATYAAAPSVSRAIPVIYPFDGFLAPVSNPPMLNIARAGGWVPLRFSLGGDRGLNIITGGAPTVTQTTCPSVSRTAPSIRRARSPQGSST